MKQLDEAHRDVVEHEQSQKGADNLISRPDGTFEAPDGMVYKLDDDDTLVNVGSNKPVDPPVVGEATPLAPNPFKDIKPIKLKNGSEATPINLKKPGEELGLSLITN